MRDCCSIGVGLWVYMYTVILIPFPLGLKFCPPEYNRTLSRSISVEDLTACLGVSWQPQ